MPRTGPKAETLARPLIDGMVCLRDLFLAHAGEVGALREVLPRQAVGVLVGAALPGVMRRGEVERGTRDGLDLGERRELFAAV